MLDYQSTLYGPLYRAHGVAATVALYNTDETELEITVIDKTAGIPVGDSVQTQTIRAVACARVKELTDKGMASTDELPHGHITFNGFTWTIEDFITRPSPNGIADGEVWLLLTEKENAELEASESESDVASDAASESGSASESESESV